MPWCPNCKTEYQDGIEVCADCGTTLVDELPEGGKDSVVAYIADEALASKLVDYLKYSSIDAEYSFGEEMQSYAVVVEEKDLPAAKTAFRGFYNVEANKQLMKERAVVEAFVKAESDEVEIDEDILEEIPEEEMSREEKAAIAKAVMAQQMYKPAEVYVKKEDVSKDMFSTALTFLGFAIALLIFLVLNALNIVTLFNNPLSLTMLGVMAVGCCLVGINAIKRSRNAERDSVEEKEVTNAINAWLNENITDDIFAELDKEELSSEILYLRRTEIIKAKLLAEYSELDENFADALIEDFYNEHFEDAIQ